MANLFDRVAVETPTTGTGTVNIGSAISTAFLTPAEGGAQNGESSIPYLLVDGADFEIGYGTFSTGTPDTFSRDSVTRSKISGSVGTSKINLSGSATLFLVPGAAEHGESKEWTAETVSQAEAEAGSATTRRAWTAQRIAQAIVEHAKPNDKQLASSWVNFDGESTVAIRDSYNVTSITDNGTGDYTINFANSLANSNYAVVIGGRYDVTDVNLMTPVYGIRRTGGSLGTSALRVVSTRGDSSAGFDCDVVSVVTFGG